MKYLLPNVPFYKANLHIEGSPAARIQVVTSMRLCHLCFAPEGETICSADFDMTK